jgi:tripartite-type tricarboxylate transporter receptor subunit TctC
MRRTKTLIAVLLTLALLILVCAGCSGGKQEAPYPNRSITAIVYSGAGGALDTIARGVLPVLQEKIGEAVAITNMAGGAGGVGAEYVLSKDADGYTVLFGSEMFSLWQTMGMNDMSIKDFTPVMITCLTIPVLAVPPDSPYETAQELIDYALAHPGELSLSIPGTGTIPHVMSLLLKQELGVEFNLVPYPSTTESITAVMGGQVDGTIEMIQSMVEPYKGGLIKLLAPATKEPVGDLGIPTMAEAIPQMTKYLPYGPYFGLYVKTGTDQAIVDTLVAKMQECVQSDAWIEYTDKLFIQRMDLVGDDALAYINDWTAKAAYLVYDAGAAAANPADFGIERPAD